MDDLFRDKGIFSSGMLHVSAHEAYEICKQGGILIDVREDYLLGYKLFDVEQVIYCPYSIITKKYNELPKDKALIFADATGIHSKEAVQFMIEKGYEKIANLAGGLVEWERDGVSIKTDITEMLSGSCTCQLRKRNKNKK